MHIKYIIMHFTHMAIHLTYELEILAKAIHFKNLSGASSQIGLSQPQLSRIIKKIELELTGIHLLDRTSKRSAHWTKSAYELVKIYLQNKKYFSDKILGLIQTQTPSSVKIGSLEGMMSSALDHSKKLLDQPFITLVELDIYDLDVLEGMFLSGELDIIFTIREPSKTKYNYYHVLGSQKVVRIHDSDSPYDVYSTFEYQSSLLKQSKKTKLTEKKFISNSLHLRDRWLSRFGGSGTLPSPIISKENKTKHHNTKAYMIGTPTLHSKIWESLT